MKSLIYFASILPLIALPSLDDESAKVELQKRQFFPLYDVGYNYPYLANGYPFYGWNLGPGLPLPTWRSDVTDKVEAEDKKEAPNTDDNSGRLQRRQAEFLPGPPGPGPVNFLNGGNSQSNSFNQLSYWLNFHNTRDCTDGHVPFWAETRPWCLSDLQ